MCPMRGWRSSRPTGSSGSKAMGASPGSRQVRKIGTTAAPRIAPSAAHGSPELVQLERPLPVTEWVVDPREHHGHMGTPGGAPVHHLQRVARRVNSSSRSMIPNARSGVTSMIAWLRTKASIWGCTVGSSQYFVT